MASTLILRVTSANRTELTNDGVFFVSKDGAFIGRGETCEIVLHDPDKVISSQHAEISWDSGHFMITDQSTNGLFINNESSPLGRGVSHALTSETQLAIGDYTMVVELESAMAPENPIPSDQSDDSELLHAGFDPLANGRSSQLDVNQQSPILDTSADAEAWTSEKRHVTDEWSEQSLSSSSSTDQEDWSVGSAGVDHGDSVNDPFLAPTPTLDTNLSASLQPEEIGANDIPEDWMLDEAMASPSEASKSAPNVSSSLPEPPRDSPASNINIETPQTEAGGELAKDISRDDSPKSSESDDSPAIQGQSARCGETYSPLEDALLQGLMDLLAARAELKNEFRMDRTIIRPVENNPLKFAPNLEVAKSLLSGEEDSAYLSTDQAVTESFTDIKHHQLALMVGMREALRQLAERLNPQNFEVNSNASGLGKLVGSDDKRSWQAYKDFYRTRIIEADDPFDELFGRALSEAYQAALSKKSSGEA